MNDYEVTKVKTVSLNDVLSSYEKVKILKLDTEGAEYEILMNSTSLEKVETILGEYHNDLTDKTLSDLIKFLESKNFIIYNTVRFNETSGLFFATHQSKMKEKTMTTENTALTYQPIMAQQAVTDYNYLHQAF